MDLGTVASGVLSFFTGGGSSAVSAIGGGIIGGIASIFRMKHDYKMKALDLEDKKDQRKHDENILMKEIAGAENLQKLKAEETTTKKEYEGLVASIKSDMATFSQGFADKMSPTAASFVGIILGFVDFIRGLVRPGIAIYSTYFMFNKIWRMIPVKTWQLMFADKDLASQMAIATLNACIFISTTAISWWFGSRPSKPPLEVNGK
jgi:hypothetical protein